AALERRRKLRRMASTPLTPEELFARLNALGIAYKTYTHPPVFTVAEAVALRGELPGGHCKSLFLKDKKAGLWLVVALEERRVDLKRWRTRSGRHASPSATPICCTRCSASGPAASRHSRS